jgi:outer membrane protein TolC
MRAFSFCSFASIGMLLIGANLLIGGCATVSRDSGFETVAFVAKDRLDKEVKWARSDNDAENLHRTVKDLLAKPFTADSAVQIALINNRGLQATYGELGIAEADLVQAGRLRNPRFTFLRERAGNDTRIERTYTFDFISLLTAPLARRIEGRRFELTKLLVANDVLRVAAETRKAWYRAVAAEQTVLYMLQVKMAAEAGAELARGMAKAGNWSNLDQAREQVFYADATAQLARAKHTAVNEREKLTRLMGLWGEDVQLRLPDRLPDLPAAPAEFEEIESFAIAQRLDIQATKQETAGLAASLGLTKTTRFINVLEASYLRNSETGRARETGYEITLELPLFDWRGARVAKAEAIYMQAVNRVAETAINARSEVRESYAGYLTSYELAKHYRDEIVPLRKKISNELLTRYNGMLVSVFELLADSREQVSAVNASIEAQRDYWMAETELQVALGGKLPTTLAANSLDSKKGR